MSGDFTAHFETIVTGIRTGVVGEFHDVIRKVEFIVRGTLQGQTFELPQWCDLSEPQAATFKPLAEVTETDVINWINNNFENMDGVKTHIQFVLDQEAAKASLKTKPLPWVQ